MTNSDREPLGFRKAFTQWLTMRRFSGFDLEEFQNAAACAEAEAGFADYFEQCETELLEHIPGSFAEMACQLEVIRESDDLTPSGRQALMTVQAGLVMAMRQAGRAPTADDDILMTCLIATGLEVPEAIAPDAVDAAER